MAARCGMCVFKILRNCPTIFQMVSSPPAAYGSSSPSTFLPALELSIFFDFSHSNWCVVDVFPTTTLPGHIFN